MALEKHRAVVVRTIKYSETSKIVTLYSLKTGLLKVIAKGVRKSTSHLSGILEPLNIVEVVFYHNPNRELHTLSQAEIIYSPNQLRHDAEDTLLALACCEMITRVQMLHDENAEVYRLLEGVIAAFNSSKPATRRIYFLTFQLQLLRAVGLEPDLSRCSSCKTQHNTRWYFDFKQAALKCEKCSDNLSRQDVLHEKLRAALGYLLRVEITQIPEPERLILYQKNIYHFLTQFYKYHLEEMLNLKSLAVLQKMKSFQSELMRSNSA